MTEPPPLAVPPLLLHRLRWRLFRNTFRTAFSKSALRPITAAVVSVLVAGLVFGVSLDGFWFLRDNFHLNLHGEVLGILLDVLFLVLAVMLVFSGGLILYGSLFTAPETAFLFATPVPEDRVFAYKFQGATAFSSWAFLLLGGPLLIAYGIAAYAPWSYYVFVPVFFFGFVLLPASVGGLLCLLVVNFVPRHRMQVLIACAAVVGARAATRI
jgi:ABC-2 type transport system permease protein